MIYTRRTFAIILALVMVMLLAACGSSTSSSTGSGSNPTPTQAAATPTTASPSPTATSSGSTAALVKTATATVGGKSETILTDAQGKTLYYFTADSATTSACTSGCAQAWPPLLATGSGAPTSANTLPGKLTAVTTGNGNQVEYNGHLLYTYAGDTAPGDTKGEGLFGKWFVCTPDVK